MMNKAKRIEMVYHAIQNAKDTIALIYRPDEETYTHPLDHIVDKEVKDFYYDLNNMCCQLGDMNVMNWQKEELNNGNQS